MTKTWVRRLGATTRLTALAMCGVLVFAGPAGAATVSQSTASALEVALLSTPLIAVSSAADDGSVPQRVSTLNGLIPLVPGETLTNTGVYAQTAIANAQGASAACAGVLGSGGALSVGADGTCDASTTSGPAIINLPGFTVAGTGFTFSLTLSALYAVCTAGPSGSSTGFSAQSTLANVTLKATAVVFGVPTATLSLPINLNGSLAIPPPFSSVLSLAVNQVDASGPATSATAFHIGLGPNSSVASLDLGKVTCGANAVTADTPMLPAKGLWVAGSIVAVIGAGYAATRRRRALATT